MNKTKVTPEDLLNRIAKNMGCKVTTWNTVNEAVEKNISFGKIIELDKFMTKEEIKQIQDKRRIF